MRGAAPSTGPGPPGRWSITATARSSAPVDVVWPLIGEATRWRDWTAFPTAKLRREGTPAPDGVGALRHFGFGPMGSPPAPGPPGGAPPIGPPPVSPMGPPAYLPTYQPPIIMANAQIAAAQAAAARGVSRAVLLVVILAAFGVVVAVGLSVAMFVLG